MRVRLTNAIDKECNTCTIYNFYISTQAQVDWTWMIWTVDICARAHTHHTTQHKPIKKMQNIPEIVKTRKYLITYTVQEQHKKRKRKKKEKKNEHNSNTG